ncbi:MAG: hypothetical protein ACRC9L_03760 [Brevinema sp.]
MKKISFLSLFFAVVATTAWAQDEAPKQSRNLSFYSDITSGHLAPGIVTADGNAVDTNLLFTGNEMEFGLRYSQNFKSAPMVTMGGTFTAVTHNENLYDASGKFLSIATPTFDRMKANVWVSVPYFMMLIDTRGLMGLYLNHNISFGRGGSIGFGTDLEFFFGDPFYGANSRGGLYVVDYFGVWFSYGIALGKGFSYSTGIQFRLTAFTGGVNGGVEVDPAAAFNIRWANTFSYSHDGWNFYVQFRLEGFNLAKSETIIRDANARFRVVTGFSYTFDLAK